VHGGGAEHKVLLTDGCYFLANARRGTKMRLCARAFSVAIVGLLALTGAGVETARGECYVQAPLRPVHRTYIRRDVVEPGVYEVTRSPSVYGWTHQRVEQPGAAIWHEEPSVYRTVQVRVRTPGGSVWRSACVKGQAAVCRVRAPASYVTVEKRILVQRGRRWAERTPSSAGVVHRRILLRPYKNYAHFQRPYIALSRERVAVQPEGARWVRAEAKPDCQE
jgi:hypothetical protein